MVTRGGSRRVRVGLISRKRMGRGRKRRRGDNNTSVCLYALSYVVAVGLVAVSSLLVVVVVVAFAVVLWI